MKTLEYRNHELHFGSKKQRLSELVKSYSQPIYVYDLGLVESRLALWQNSFGGSVHYALKANHNTEILKLMQKRGAGLDVVSGGELELGLKQGFSSQKIIFSGVAKTHKEIELALNAQIKQINVESPSELKRIGEIAQKLNVKAPVAIRFNPDVNPQTHPYITTGFKENKFGMDEASLPEIIKILKDYKNLQFKGLSIHIGSQIMETDVFIEAIEKTLTVVESLQTQGHASSTLDIGGGLGIFYDRDDLEAEEKILQNYSAKVQKLLRNKQLEILTEPGRWIVAHAGVLISRVEYIKKTPYKNFLILDTGMHHLIRPALYEAEHRALALKENSSTKIKYDIVGPICESADFIGHNRELAEMQEGDFVAIADCGAYGFVMSSDYNLQPRALEIAIYTSM